MTDATHLRWKLEVPDPQEEALCAWLEARGSSAFYREADPPRACFAYFPPDQAPPESAGLAAFPGVRLLEAEAFGDEDWLAKSREGFGAFEVGTRFHVRPLWDATPGPADRLDLVVNPGLAFGTGGHETTRLCMELLEELAAAGRLKGPVLDIGAGTGILSLAAFLLGGRGLTAFDIDPDCGPAMTELVELNTHLLKGERPYDSFVGTLDHPQVRGPYAGLLANILLETIQELLPRMAEVAAPGGWLVASGILAERTDEALVSLVSHGFKPEKVLKEGEWIAVLATREAS
ncbi:MAG TPA: 50S ribosomal protein L11 methyltransferase [Geothrix sp.]|uniref:50S ribosomal protein L11 methyltransferase n=1 Tax=Geothrix mesophila TaxID=2922723 RepID=UPI001FAC6B87|nr:50S ribosomal protein L11 methyltransferase [Geothrix sp. SG198]HJV39454.1 50S ribosomal protein L11 methyltransferase [Geothrix sp.]